MLIYEVVKLYISLPPLVFLCSCFQFSKHLVIFIGLREESNEITTCKPFNIT